MDKGFNGRVAFLVIATIVVDEVDVPSFSADDSSRHGGVEIERIAHSKNPFTHPGIVGINKGQIGQVFLTDLDQCNVRVGICANDVGLERTVIVQRYFHHIGTLNDVIVCNNEAVGINNNPRSGALARSSLLRVGSEKELQRIIGFFGRDIVGRNRTDIDHGLCDLFGGGCKIKGHRLAVFNGRITNRVGGDTRDVLNANTLILFPPPLICGDGADAAQHRG